MINIIFEIIEFTPIKIEYIGMFKEIPEAYDNANYIVHNAKDEKDSIYQYAKQIEDE